MRVGSYLVALTLASTLATPAAAQSPSPLQRDVLSFDLGAGVSRYGPHVLGGLEVSMNRWLAARADLLAGVHTEDTFYAARHLTAFSVAGVVSTPPAWRITPYLMAGYGVSASRVFSPETGPLVGGGLRLRLGRVSTYAEVRGQHRTGTPITIGLRF